MKVVRSIRFGWSWAALLCFGLAVGYGACGGDGMKRVGNSSDGGDGGSSTGGKSGGSGGSSSSSGRGGSSSSNGGSGGSSSSSGGSGDSGGSGGAAAGGAGGISSMAGAGGMSPMAGTSGGSATCGITTNETVDTSARCDFRTDHPTVHMCGPCVNETVPTLGAVKAGAPAWCNDTSAMAYTNDGIFTVNQTTLDGAAKNTSASGTRMNVSGVPLVSAVYLPNGMSAYQAAQGEVALTFWLGLFTSNQGYNFEGIHDYLIKRGDMPYAIMVYMNIDQNQTGSVPEWITTLKTQTIPKLKAMFPKISDKPSYRSIAGQSTGGTIAWDVVWMGTDVIAKGYGGSPSLTCFGCLERGDNDGYVKDIEFCPKRAIRWSATVGTCDIYGTLEERLQAGCNGDTGAGAVDASQCQATWLTLNTNVANALKAKGTPYQLFKVTGGGHTPSTWGQIAAAYQLRWLFKDITCYGQ